MIFVPFPDNDITDEEKKLYIREIQEILRSLEIAQNGCSDVPIDGIFGPKTGEAVMAFQRAHGLAPTGVVDRVTFYRLVEEYSALAVKDVLTLPIKGFPTKPGFAFRRGDTGDGVAFLNIMLRTLSNTFSNIPTPSETADYTEETAAAVSVLQTVMGLAPTGVTNRRTWNGITGIYNDMQTGSD
jgi:peptidoglycan hydrolase-like protein with peptidoglycan-binding domain